MCSSILLSSTVVSAAAEWDWTKGLSGMGSKYCFLQVDCNAHDLFAVIYLYPNTIYICRGLTGMPS